MNRELREEVFAVLAEMIPRDQNGHPVSRKLGSKGMELWAILVMGVLRLGLDIDYDRQQEWVNQHKTIRQMLGPVDWDDPHLYSEQTLKDHMRRFTPELLDRINAVVVRAGHALVKKTRKTR